MTSAAGVGQSTLLPIPPPSAGAARASALAQFLERFPHAEIVIEDDDGAPDDGGFLDDGR